MVLRVTYTTIHAVTLGERDDTELNNINNFYEDVIRGYATNVVQIVRRVYSTIAVTDLEI